MLFDEVFFIDHFEMGEVFVESIATQDYELADLCIDFISIFPPGCLLEMGSMGGEGQGGTIKNKGQVVGKIGVFVIQFIGIFFIGFLDCEGKKSFSGHFDERKVTGIVYLGRIDDGALKGGNQCLIGRKGNEVDHFFQACSLPLYFAGYRYLGTSCAAEEQTGGEEEKQAEKRGCLGHAVEFWGKDRDYSGVRQAHPTFFDRLTPLISTGLQDNHLECLAT